MRARLTTALAAALLLLLVPVAPAAAQRGLTTGFLDNVYGEDEATAAAWLDRTVGLGAGLVRVNAPWDGIAPTRPANAADPDDPAYRWQGLDTTVRRLRARGLDVLVTVYRAPRWAEGAGRPRTAAAGSWKPGPAALGAFARALASRYDGTRPDLPRVRRFMLWNEPNLASYLAPQWTRRKGRYRAAAPAHYRRMLLAFTPAIKAAATGNTVVAGATSPYGDPSAGGERMQPARFVRELLCVGRARCSSRPRFDVLSHHPYSVGRPRRRALNRDDVSIPDLGKLRRLLRAARREREIPRTPRLWVTEVSYDSSPPDPDGVPAARHARWVAETLYLLWRQGASAVVWLQIRDSPPTPSYAASYQSGMFLRDGRAKPAARAFRFPLVVDRGRAWGKAPAAGRLVIERRSGGRWRRAAALDVRAGQVFRRRVARGSAYRARVGDQVSVTWR